MQMFAAGIRSYLGIGVSAALAVLLVALPAAANTTPQALPFAQGWTNIGLITTDDDWNGVLGVIGYRGDDLTTATGTDPQTILADGTSTPVDVNANQTSPNTFATGGVAEFELADPVVALNGSGTADAPFVLLTLNTTGLANVNVAYNLRDLDGSADNASQQVALQYRVGSSGNFTNVPAGYVADATTGPSLATLVTPISVTLPAAVNNQPEVQIRVITSNAAGNDEWVGLDDIVVSSSAADQAPSVQTTTPSNGATDVAVGTNVSITFSEPVNATGSAFTISCASSGAHSATVTGGPTSFTLDPSVDFANNELCTVTVLAANVTDQDANDPPDNMAANHVITFTTQAGPPCAEPFTPIYSIQGSGASAAITGNVTTQGVVVGDFDGPTSTGLQGFYLQDPTGDGNPATSDGIFVFTGDANPVSAGQVVRVTGFARERFNQTALNGSNSNTSAVTNIVDCGTTGSVTATDVTMPFADATYPERYEGMLVRFPQSLVISEYFNYDRFGELVLALPLPGETRPFTPTSVVEPGAPAQARALANSLRRITLDDGRNAENPEFLRHPNGAAFALSNRFRGGDTVQNTVGVLGFDFSLYRIQPTGPAAYTAANPRPAAPDPVGGSLKVAAMNTLNFFLTLDYPTGNPLDNKCGPSQNVECRGADSDQPTEFNRQRDKLLAALAGLKADIIGLNELENTTGVDPLRDPTKGVVPGLNAMPGVGPYAAVNTGVIGTDAIRVGLIYRTDKVVPIGPFKLLTSAIDPRFLDTLNRPVLAQTFEVIGTGARFTVAVNHLKSKGSACTGDPDTGDGQGNCNQTRKAAAQALVDWLATDPTGSGDPDFLIIGDLNSYAKEDPIDAILAGRDDTLGSDDDYTNLVAGHIGPHAYSYVFDGQSGYLDHALSSASLTGQVTGVAEWHIDADEPDVVDYDTTFKGPAQEALYEPNGYRASDHDPILVGLNPTGPQCLGFDATITGSGTIVGTNGPDVIVGSTGNDTILGGNGNDIICGNLGDDQIDGGSGDDTIAGDSAISFGNPTAPGGNDTILGGNGDDEIIGEAGNDTIDAGNGNDFATANVGADTVSGGNGNDELFGGQGPDVVHGENGNDSLFGTLGDDVLRGGNGDDFLNGDLPPDQDAGGGPGVDPTPGNHDTCQGDNGRDTAFGCEVRVGVEVVLTQL
jgi:predicted extracellular nuclease